MFGPEHDKELLQQWRLEDRMDDPDYVAGLMAWAYFAQKVLCPNVKPGWSFDGCSFSRRGQSSLLVVKATHEDTPYVAFTTEQTTTGCVRSFCRRWLEERVEWFPDRFR